MHVSSAAPRIPYRTGNSLRSHFHTCRMWCPALYMPYVPYLQVREDTCASYKRFHISWDIVGGVLALTPVQCMDFPKVLCLKVQNPFVGKMELLVLSRLKNNYPLNYEHILQVELCIYWILENTFVHKLSKKSSCTFLVWVSIAYRAGTKIYMKFNMNFYFFKYHWALFWNLLWPSGHAMEKFIYFTFTIDQYCFTN